MRFLRVFFRVFFCWVCLGFSWFFLVGFFWGFFARRCAQNSREGIVKRHLEREGGGGGRGGAEMTQLPMDILNRVFRFLDARSLASASSVSTEWHSHAEDEWLWEQHVRFTFFKGEEGSVGKEEVSWRERFQELQAGAVYWIGSLPLPPA